MKSVYFNDYLSIFKNENNADFDVMFFGYMKIAYRNLMKPESKALVMSLIKEKINQYKTMKYINQKYPYTGAANDSLQSLMGDMRLRT